MSAGVTVETGSDTLVSGARIEDLGLPEQMQVSVTGGSCGAHPPGYPT